MHLSRKFELNLIFKQANVLMGNILGIFKIKIKILFTF